MARYWVKTSTESPSSQMVSTISTVASNLPDRPTRSPGVVGSCFRNWAGWLQICFSPVSSLSTRPRRWMPSASSTRARVSATMAS